MPTKIDVANMALSVLGNRARIESFDDDGTEAATLSLHYGTARDEALIDVNPRFARKRAALAPKTGTPPEPWLYQYAVPVDCLRPLHIDDGLARRRLDQAIPFEVEDFGDSTRVLYTDWPDAILIYTARMSEGVWTPHFVSAAAARVAAAIAYEVTESREKEREALQVYEYRLARARAVEASWRQLGEPPISAIEEARR